MLDALQKRCVLGEYKSGSQFMGLAANHLNNLLCIASLSSFARLRDLNTLGVFGKVSTGCGKVDRRLAVSMTVARSLGSIPPNSREMPNSERLPQIRQ